ncbi:MAG: flavin-containing monooxygenase [Gammaproteobacteria bacterium]
MNRNEERTGPDGQDFDAIVVGAGFGGLYGVYRLRAQGLRVLGIEAGGGVGGVWYHNRYPGARVDVESYDYCYYFSEDLYREWVWTEKYATQPELLRYLDHVADRFDLRRHYLFDTRVTGARWTPEQARYQVTTSTGRALTCRFLVMATGQLSAARRPPFEGLERFKGEWVETQHWPHREVKLQGRRIGVVGTGSSGVQAIPVLAQAAEHLYVFQRTPKFSVPAHNGPIEGTIWSTTKRDVAGERAKLFDNPGAGHMARPQGPASDFTPEQQRQILDEYWALGGQHFQAVFADQGSNKASNDVIANYVRDRIRSVVKDPRLAEKLCPDDHPFGTRRLIVDTGYYATFNRDNVTLVDVRAQPITRITETGIEIADGSHYACDLIVFALGFDAFTGSLYGADIRNERGERISDRWRRGPRTLLGLTTTGFPNLFLPTGPGSPSLIANLVVQNEFHIDWIADCIAWMDTHGYASIEPTAAAEVEWTAHVAEVAKNLLRLHVKNYMVHVNEDGSRVYLPYAGGMDRYAKRARAIAAGGYREFRFSTAEQLRANRTA